MKNLKDVSALQMPAKEKHHIHIIDGNALFCNQSQLPKTFGELAYNIIILYPFYSSQSPFPNR